MISRLTIIVSCDRCNSDKLYCATTTTKDGHFECQLACQCRISSTNPNGIISGEYVLCPSTPIKSKDHISRSHPIGIKIM